MTRVVVREAPLRAAWALEQAGLPPLLARLYAARGIRSAADADTRLAGLLPPDGLKGAAAAAHLLADAFAAGRKLLIVADYDCDGATACATGILGLRALMRASGAAAASVDYLVPNRFETGYGLSPEVVEQALRHRNGKPDILITVDNGIASVAGVAAAKAAGMAVLVTDHHLPGDELPAADVIVNPNQPGCDFQSKAIAGVGVMFYVLLALRAELRRRGAFAAQAEPNLAELLDLVAVGTIADVAALDRNNRILVAQGLARIRDGRLRPGLTALFRVAGRDPASAGSFDLGFTVGPRINAAGRLGDMGVGIECLIADDMNRALNIAQQMDALNRERREIENGMKDDANLLLATIDAGEQPALSLFDPSWHQGVIGILAGRLKEKLHRPVIAFARGAEGELKGSGRSIPGLHLRDALDLVDKRHPGLILRFGGHAAAAGLALRETDLPRFTAAFEQVARQLLSPADLTRTLEVDATLESAWYSLEAAKMIQGGVWGQGFPQPLFAERFEVESQRLLQEKHLKLRLRLGNVRHEAIWFNAGQPVPERVFAAFRLTVNEFRGVQSLQLNIEHCEAD
ncbi:MAG: single-stranded-DNA-specific exonuclease RecJ [Rhodocyclaceae bacterium]|jgi:single-stranded-DNA-specific exonuclease|nr:single-stranded-DNA-specific exonuclease RecJ [Rhodocyclaceae bacterium]